MKIKKDFVQAEFACMVCLARQFEIQPHLPKCAWRERGEYCPALVRCLGGDVK